MRAPPWCQVVEATSRRSYASRGVSHSKAALGRSLISSTAVSRGHCNSRCGVLHRNVTSRVTSIAAHSFLGPGPRALMGDPKHLSPPNTFRPPSVSLRVSRTWSAFWCRAAGRPLGSWWTPPGCRRSPPGRTLGSAVWAACCSSHHPRWSSHHNSAASLSLAVSAASDRALRGASARAGVH